MMSFKSGALFFISILMLLTSTLPFSFEDIVPEGKPMSPRWQISHGVLPQQVVCYDDLVLIKKLYEDSVACVKAQTAIKLFDRNWMLVEISKTANLYATRIGPLSTNSSLVLGDLQPLKISNQTLTDLPTIKKAILNADQQYDQYQARCNYYHYCPQGEGPIPDPTVYLPININEMKLAFGILNFNILDPNGVKYGTNVQYYEKYSIIIFVYP